MSTTASVPTEMQAFATYFADLEDPRLDRTRKHELLDIVILAILAVIGNSNTWEEVAIFAREHEPWLKRYLRLPNGTPSKDTFRRVFAALNPDSFLQGWQHWMQSFALSHGYKLVTTKRRHYAVDGKTHRRSGGLNQSALPTVSVWATENQLTLAQVATDAKSNEITAIPEVLGLLDLRGAVITIDAMGCQKEIAQTLRQGGADYILSLKENHPNLFDHVYHRFLQAFEDDFPESGRGYFRTEEEGHGRQDLREYYILPVDAHLPGLDEWPDLTTLVLVSRYRQVDGQQPTQTWQLYLSSLAASARLHSGYIRGHWSIENQQHWTLDIVFREDENRMRAGHSAANFGLLRRMALSLLKQDQGSAASLPCKRHRAAINPQYALDVLLGSTLE